MKDALITIDKYITTHNIDARIITSVYDSVYIEIKEELDTDWIPTILANSLEKYLLGRIKGKSDKQIAKTWK